MVDAGGKEVREELGIADWRKVGEGDDQLYFEAVEEPSGHLYGDITSISATQE